MSTFASTAPPKLGEDGYPVKPNITLHELQWRQIYEKQHKDSQNAQYSMHKHFKTASHMEKRINQTRTFATFGSAFAAGGIITSMASYFEHHPRLGKRLTIASAVTSATVAGLSSHFLAPAYCQKAVRHREAGNAYEALHDQQKSYLATALLSSEVPLEAAVTQVNEIGRKKVELDNNYKDILWPDWIHWAVKPQVHTPVPAREWRVWRPNFETTQQYRVRWTEEFKLRQKTIIEERVQSRLRAEAQRAQASTQAS